MRVPELGGAGLEVLEQAASKSESVVLWRYAHAFELGALVAGASQAAHRDEMVVQKADDEVAALVEIDASDRVEVVVPGTRPAMRSGVVERIVVQRPHSVVV